MIYTNRVITEEELYQLAAFNAEADFKTDGDFSKWEKRSNTALQFAMDILGADGWKLVCRSVNPDKRDITYFFVNERV